MFFRAWQRARGQLVASSAGGVAWPRCRRAAARRAGCRPGSGCPCCGRAGLVPARGAGRGRGDGCAGAPGGRGACAPVPVRGRVFRWMVEGGRARAGVRAWARVVLGCGCAVCGILRACACGRVVFLGAVGDAWCSLRGDGVASVVVVVWCRVVYPPNKTCNAKTSYKYAILVLACKSLCGA